MGLEGRKEDRKEGKNMYKCILKKGEKKKHGSWNEERMQGRKERGREGRKEITCMEHGRNVGKRRKEERRNNIISSFLSLFPSIPKNFIPFTPSPFIILSTSILPSSILSFFTSIFPSTLNTSFHAPSFLPVFACFLLS